MRPRPFGLALLLAALLAQPAASVDRLDPRLAHALTADSPEVAVWVEVADQRVARPGDLVRRLAEAEAALTPEARRRRERARVRPLVYELDLPVEPAYMNALNDAGFAP
ncbi:MAG: hypothetical protein ACKOC6_12885 [bacterium]